TSCSNCGGRGLLLHADPVDSMPANGRKSESSGRSRRRSKKGRADEPVVAPAVAKVPAHAPGEHPMFKAMAAGSAGTPESADVGDDESDAGLVGLFEEQVEVQGVADFDDAGQDDFEDEDELDEDEDDLDDDEDLDDVDEDLDLDDDIEDTDDDESDDEGSGIDTAAVSIAERPRRRRAAGRPAGPPIHAE
ncbi:MAG: ribonuclease E/G, partial [Mycobacteriaceae bacterium]|nr:ribonuclease E/G [Mycobacteriaceae bacterium]